MGVDFYDNFYDTFYDYFYFTEETNPWTISFLSTDVCAGELSSSGDNTAATMAVSTAGGNVTVTQT